MNKQVCFIGDSHVASLRLGLDTDGGAEFKDQIDIFGARGRGLFSTRIEEGQLVSDAQEVRDSFVMTGKADHIDIARYEAICVVGCLGGWPRFENVFKHFSPLGERVNETALVSKGFMDRLLKRQIEQTMAVAVMRELAEKAGKPLFYIPNPLFSKSILEHPKGFFFRRAMRTGAAGPMIERFRGAVRAMIAPYAMVLDQPVETIVPPCFTDERFSVGSVRLSERAPKHKDDDFAHMNADFGAIVIRDAMRQIRQAKAA
ncbi:hypothetical protein [Rhizobium alvei]|uniref:Uncharacterized protein n=1 Tax=Rhizobium alvei TaxID=1132659 RepID=A0ABT8YL81_9HYPH|nr:hypothetical protein [Rhizobium alvei]MDO6964489.1 hypothetical protein [Rhizobium alvei]